MTTREDAHDRDHSTATATPPLLCNSTKHATYVDAFGEPKALFRVQRVYSIISKVKVHLGDDTWTDVQDFPTDSILFDGGARAGWMLPAWRDSESLEGEQDQQQVTETRESRKKQLLILCLLQHLPPQPRRPPILWASGSPTSVSPARIKTLPANAR